MTRVHTLDVTLNFRQTYYPEKGSGKLNGIEITRKGRFPLALKGVAGPEAAPVVTLGFHETGSTITLREHGGVLYRPVLAPGTHSPCTVADFEEAGQGDVSWLDDPFRKRSSYEDRGPVAPESVAARCTEPREQVRKYGWTTEAEVREETRTRSADLLVVDGVVHVACPQPTLVLKTRVDPMTGNITENVLTWTLPNLEGDDDPSTGPTTLEKYTDHELKWIKDDPRERSRPRSRKRFEPGTWRTFGVTAAREAEAFSRELSDLSGLALLEPDDLAVVHDPRPLGKAVEPPPAKTAERALDMLGSDLEKQSDAYITAWMGARRKLREGRLVDALDDLAAMTGIDVDGRTAPTKDKRTDWKGAYGYAHLNPSLYLLRYALIGRAALTARVEADGAEDDASLAALAPAP